MKKTVWALTFAAFFSPGIFCAEGADALESAKMAFEAKPATDTSRALAGIFQKAGKQAEGLEYFKKEAGDSRASVIRRAGASYGLGVLHSDAYAWAAALEAFASAERGFGKEGEAAQAAIAANDQGITRFYMGDYRGAIEHMQRALGVQESLGNKRPMADAISNIGTAHDMMGEFAEAALYYERSLSFRSGEDPRDRRGIGVVLNNLGSMLRNMGDYEGAESRIRQSLEIFERDNDVKHQAMALGNMANVFLYRGEYSQALAMTRQALELNRKVGNRYAEGYALQSIGSIYGYVGDVPRAREYMKASLAIRREIGDKNGVAEANENLGVMAYMQDDFEGAIAHHGEALSINREIGDRSSTAKTLNNLGNAHLRTGHLDEAERYFLGALKEAEEVGLKDSESTGLSRLSELSSRRQKPEEGLDFALRSLAVAMRTSSVEIILSANLAVARLSLELGKRDQGLKHLRLAMDSSESLRSLLEESDLRAAWMGQKIVVYEEMVEALLEQQASSQKPVASKINSSLSGYQLLETGYSSEAFSITERMRARGFLDEMGTAKYLREGVPPELMEQKRRLEARMKWLGERQ